jgi:hypothetical protein
VSKKKVCSSIIRCGLEDLEIVDLKCKERSLFLERKRRRKPILDNSKWMGTGSGIGKGSGSGIGKGSGSGIGKGSGSGIGKGYLIDKRQENRTIRGFLHNENTRRIVTQDDRYFMVDITENWCSCGSPLRRRCEHLGFFAGSVWGNLSVVGSS